MALSILDGNQSATTLSTILTSGQHITAHTVVSLGTQAITDMRSAVSGSVVSISNFPSSQSTTFGAVTGSVLVLNFPSSQSVTFTAISVSNFPSSQTTTFGAVTGSISVLNFPATQAISISSVTIGNSITIASCVTHGVTIANSSITVNGSFYQTTQPVSLASLPSLAAGTAQIGSVTAFISGTVPISISSVTVGNSVTIGSLPAISGTVTANTFALQGTAVTTSNFTSTTASTVLASFNATREVLTIFNEGAGNLHICAGATCTTIAYQVRLSSGDYYEVPNHQTTITHSAVFATAGTARVTQVS